MKLETIKERIRVGRFKPFEVHLSDGKVVSVLHPDFILFAPSSEEFVVVTPDNAFNIIAADEVTRIRLLPDRPKASAAG